MFVSFDNGGRWQSFQLNLPVTPITDIRVHRQDLVVAMQGRGFWILDKRHAAPSAHRPEPVRYGRPGLQAHITYLAGMTSRGDQKIGRDAIECYAVLKKELDAVNRDLDDLLGR